MSRFLWDSRLLFLHIPRTGGTWIEQALVDLRIRHSTWANRQAVGICKKHSLLGQQHFSHLKRVWYVAAFVRHPADYYAATWRWIAGVRPSRRPWMLEVFEWHPLHCAIRQFDDDFDVFVERMLNNHAGWVTRLFDQYVGPEGGEFADWIGRQETLSRDFIQLIGTFSHPGLMQKKTRAILESDRQNVGKITSVKWDPGLRVAVEYVEREAIQRFYGEETLDQRAYSRLKKELAGEIETKSGVHGRALFPRPK